MDQLDEAKALEMADRQRAIANHQAKAQEPEQWIDNGIVCCIDCEVPIPTERLDAKPNAARCIECQSLYELQDHC